MKTKIKKMMDRIKFIRENNLFVVIYYIHKANKLCDLRDIAPRPLVKEWRAIARDFSNGCITPREMYMQTLDSARKYKLA